MAANIAYDVAQRDFYLFYYKIKGAVAGDVVAPNGSYTVCYRRVSSGAGSSAFQSAEEYCPPRLRDLSGKWLGATTAEVMGDGTGYDIGAVYDGNVAIAYEDNCAPSSAACTLSVYRSRRVY